MATAALIAYLLYLALAFGLRTVVQIRETGSSGFKGASGRVGSVEWLAGALFVLALLVGFSAPVLALLNAVEPLSALDTAPAHATGVALFLLGLVLTLLAQLAMGTSWRIGVDENERTELVTSGPFAFCRNPIFAAMIPTSIGLAFMVPSVAAIIGVVALVVALQLQVRVVEEPYLARTHGRAYTDYAATVGRFLPGIGKIA